MIHEMIARAKMKILKKLFRKSISLLFILYIRFVYSTSKIIITGKSEVFRSHYKEKFVFSFWHGCSYCFYPLLKGEKLCVIMTEDIRGEYISDICRYFGYTPIRVPDQSTGGNFFLKIRKTIKDEANASVAITFDGPLGPYHEPKIFPFAVALFTKRRVVPLSIDPQRKIILSHRWDQFMIPLPFNRIQIVIHEPIEVKKEDLKEEFRKQRKCARDRMEQWEKII